MQIPGGLTNGAPAANSTPIVVRQPQKSTTPCRLWQIGTRLPAAEAEPDVSAAPPREEIPL